MSKLKLSARETGTAIAAIRYWQERFVEGKLLNPEKIAALKGITTSCGEFEALSTEEIDTLLDKVGT